MIYHSRDIRSTVGRCGVLGLAVCLGLVGGCKNPKHAGQEIVEVEVRTVTHYGVELGPDASPEDVVFVLLRTVRERFEAVQAGDFEKDAAGLKTLADLAAGDRIHANFKRNMHKEAQAALTKNVAVHDATLLWGPIIAHYALSFETDHAKAVSKLQADKKPNASEVKVRYEGHNSDDGSSAMIDVSLTRDQGYWRIWRVGFAPSAALASAQPKAAPTTQPSAPAPTSP